MMTFTIQESTCKACGHEHAGEELAYICVGCPCTEETTRSRVARTPSAITATRAPATPVLRISWS